jgi:hypothetical protein
MTFYARCRIDLAVDLVLIEIITLMGQRPFGGILVLVARLQLLPMRMAVGAKGLLVANHAGPALLLSEKPVPIREIARMVQRRPPVLVALAAEGSCRQFNGVLRHNTSRMGAGIDSEEHQKNKQGNNPGHGIHLLTLLLLSRSGREA